MFWTNRTLLSLTFLCVPLATSAFQTGPYTYTVKGGKATITAFDKTYTGTLAITNSLGGCPVTTIGIQAFYNCSNLTQVAISTNVTTIGDRAFSYCLRLTDITIPDSVTNIGNALFRYCPGLTNAVIGAGITNIPTYTFYVCTNLPSVTIRRFRVCGGIFH